MASGRYSVSGTAGGVAGTEDFRCAPGPAGWRYVSEIEEDEPTSHRETVDVAVDTSWRIVRVRIETGSHEIVLEPAGGILRGLQDGRRIELAWSDEMHLDYRSPAFNAITAQRLEATSEIDVLLLEPVTLEATQVRQRYELVRREVVETPAGAFEAARWRYTALRSGWTGDLWVAGDVVVGFEGAFELISYEPGTSGPIPVRT